jgi:hypothetical protein
MSEEKMAENYWKQREAQFAEQVRSGVWPQDTCEKCVQTYCACPTCGHCDWSLSKENTPCSKCGDTLKLHTTIHCCVSYGHHHLSICLHCGDDERNPRKWLFRGRGL